MKKHKRNNKFFVEKIYANFYRHKLTNNNKIKFSHRLYLLSKNSKNLIDEKFDKLYKKKLKKLKKFYNFISFNFSIFTI